MKADASNEQRFISEVDEFRFIAADIEEILRRLEDWLFRLNSDLRSSRSVSSGLSKRSALVYEAGSIDTILIESAQKWAQQWSRLRPAQELADSFEDKVLLLVFGKFNAGKSSLCNFLADRFAAHGKAVEYFHVEGGRIVETTEPFKEGATETTARLQGVRLSGKLVLLDTPGLHSVTPENAALTQRFTDSADGVLWLTSSTAPGQVQELDELGRELHRNKPLLPVVTRSDIFEEDEVDGEICKVLRNKTADNRAVQETDIKARAEEKLTMMGVPEALLKQPVSVSVYMARGKNETKSALSDAGFDGLFSALVEIIEPTLAYKRRKTAETFLHHLEENVLDTLCCDVLPLLSELDMSAKNALAMLERHLDQIERAVLRNVLPTLPSLLDDYATTRDVNVIYENLSGSIAIAFLHETEKQLTDYTVVLDAQLAKGDGSDKAAFKEMTCQHPREKIGPDKVVEVDYQRLHAALRRWIHERVRTQSRSLEDQCRTAVQNLMEWTSRVEVLVKAQEQSLLNLKRDLRANHS
jgi:predicted GTPase